MARARNGSTARGLFGQNTNPTALAPASAAATASSTRVTPQIFTNIGRSLDDLEPRRLALRVLGIAPRRILCVLDAGEQTRQTLAGNPRRHQLLADQERPISERAEP